MHVLSLSSFNSHLRHIFFHSVYKELKKLFFLIAIFSEERSAMEQTRLTRLLLSGARYLAKLTELMKIVCCSRTQYIEMPGIKQNVWIEKTTL